MEIKQKSLSEFVPIAFNEPDEDLRLKKRDVDTFQGARFVEYDILKNVNDIKIKNFTNNILTDFINVGDVFERRSETNLKKVDFNTSLIFDGFNNNQQNYLTFEPTNNSLPARVYLDSSQIQNQSFIVDLIDSFKCTIRVNDGLFVKYLTVNETIDNSISFNILSGGYADLSGSHVFNYSFDRENKYITFTKTLRDGSFKLISTNNGTISATTPSPVSNTSGVVKLTNTSTNISPNFIDMFAIYDTTNNPSIESPVGERYNMFLYFPYETINFDLSGYTADLKFFNLKNHVSDTNYINSTLPFQKSYIQREYTSILNRKNTEKNNEDLTLGYNFYTKEYIFKPGKITKFTLPNTLYPFKRININDTNLINNGAFGATCPYFSDKVFKLQDNNRNTNKQLIITAGFEILSQGPLKNIITQNGDTLVQQDDDIKYDYVNNGTFLCAWLSGDDDKKGTWYDRYYYPENTSFGTAVSGTRGQVFETKTSAQKYFEKYGYSGSYFDIESNLVFEPESTYFYQRIGNDYINKVIDSRPAIKDTFTIYTPSTQIIESPTLAFSTSGYSVFDFSELRKKSFSINFDLDINIPETFNSYQLLGNFYETGFTITNNFYFTPFMVYPSGNSINFYDSNLELVNTVTFPSISAIYDIIFLHQNSSMVVIGNDKIIKTSFTGEIIDQRTENISEILNGYKSSYSYGDSKAIILDGNNINYLDLKTLSLSTTNNYTNSSFDSCVFHNGLKLLKGSNPKVVDDSLVITMSGSDKILFNDIINNTFFSQPLSTNKTIYDIASIDSKIFVQTIGSSSRQVNVFNTERKHLSTFNLSIDAASGYKLDFIEQNGGIDMLSLSRNLSGNIIIERFPLSSPRQYKKIDTNTSATITNHVTGPFFNCTGLQNLYTKYHTLTAPLYIKVNAKNLYNTKIQSVTWNSSSFFYNSPHVGLSAWKGTFSLPNTLDDYDQEFILPINKLTRHNRFSFNFDQPNAKITFYKDGNLLGEVKFKSNRFSFGDLIENRLYFNTVNFKNENITKFIKDGRFTSKTGRVSNLKIYDSGVTEDFINYLNLRDKNIDSLNFDITSGTRTNIENFDNIYTYNIPGMKTNKFKIYIKKGYFDKYTQQKLVEFINTKIDKYIPVNTEDIEFDFSIN